MRLITYSEEVEGSGLEVRHEEFWGTVGDSVEDQLSEVIVVNVRRVSRDGRDGGDGGVVGDDSDLVNSDQNTLGQSSIALDVWKVLNRATSGCVVGIPDSTGSGSHIGSTGEEVSESKAGSGEEWDWGNERVDVLDGSAAFDKEKFNSISAGRSEFHDCRWLRHTHSLSICRSRLKYLLTIG